MIRRDEQRRSRLAATLCGMLGAWLLAPACPTMAVTINLTFDNSTPYVDPTGVNRTNELQAVMQAAAHIWEDIIEDAHTLDVTYRWGDLSEDTIGLNEFSWPNGGNRPNQSAITFDTHEGVGGAARPWYFDPTPFDDEEFVMSRSLFRNLSAQNQAAWYHGNPPDVLEAGFQGRAYASTAGDPRMNLDLLTTALHELGHALGVPGSSSGLADGDYDIPVAMVGGQLMAVVDDDGHLLNEHAAMSAGQGIGERLHPSATDVLAAASTAGWTQVDLPRKDFFGGADWNTAGNWIGDRVPDAEDDVFLQQAGIDASLNANGVADNLWLADGARLNTGNHLLSVGNDISIVSFDAAGTQLSVLTGGRVEAENIFVQNEGELVMWGGQVAVNKLEIQSLGGESGRFSMLPGATLTVNRLVGFGDTLQFLGNLGIGHAGPDPGLLTIGENQTLDVLGTTTVGVGPGSSGTVNVVFGGDVDTKGLIVGTAASSGTVAVDGFISGAGIAARWDVDGNLTVGSTGVGSGTLVVQRAADFTVTGSATVQGTMSDGTGVITVRTGGDLAVADTLNIAAGGTVNLSEATSTLTVGDIENRGGTLNWTGGTLHIDNSRLRIDDSSYADLDLSSLTVDAGMKLKVTRPTGGADSLTVGNLGTGLMMVQNGGVVESYHGYLGEVGTAVGTVFVDGESSRWMIAEDLSVGNSGGGEGWLSITNGGQVEANSIWLGRTGTSQGTIYVFGTNSTLTSHAILAVGGFIFDNGSGGAAGGTGNLVLDDGGRVDVDNTLKVWGDGLISLDGNGGTNGSTIRAATIELAPGATFVTYPGTLVQTNALLGFGDHPSFEGNLHIGHGGGFGSGSHVVSSGQSLRVADHLVIGSDGPGYLQIDNGGSVSSQHGSITQQASANGSEVWITGAESKWRLADSLHVGGDFPTQAAALLSVTDNAMVEAGEAIEVWQHGRINLDNGSLSTRQLQVLEGGRFSGTGSVSLRSANAFENSGAVTPGYEDLGTLAIDSGNYVQTLAGVLEIQIGGTDPEQYDQLNVTQGTATLDGALRVSLVDPFGAADLFVPTADDEFTILTAGDGRIGTFFMPLVELPALTGELAWQLHYGENLVRLDVRSPYSADFDGDGDVDGSDFLTWQVGFGTQGGAADGDADGDGDVDGNDFLLWQTQFGRRGGGAGHAAVPEPAAATVLLLSGLVLLGRIPRLASRGQYTARRILA